MYNFKKNFTTKYVVINNINYLKILLVKKVCKII